MADYRPELPPVPTCMRDLPVRRGYPVPWFVDVNPETSDYDFRLADGRKKARAIKEKRCWLCGEPLGRIFAFVIGPMCAINRVSSEPPSHTECADFGARGCPFLSRPREVRREDRLPDEMEAAPGLGLQRNPGVALVWITQTYTLFRAGRSPIDLPGASNGDGVLFRIGPPIEARWYAEGRQARRDEILASIENGFPSLRQVAQIQGGEAIRELDEDRAEAMKLLPGADESITCPACGMTSYNPNDIAERYCGNCHKFHDELRVTEMRSAE